MSILNRRNAVLGWAVWRIGKRVLKKKARAAVPGVESAPGGGKGKKVAIAGLAAAAAGALVWRKTRNDDEAGFSGD